ncbi:MAG: ATP-dependent DNA helicase, partial [Actinobacteria bacterium]|nr:ATP-dependent DNA helicase [Actinomycetota bacterium]
MTKLGVEDLLDATVDRLERSESRPGQVTMAREITSAIESGRHLIVQAGTGTGKSLGYLVPVALSGRRTVVATYTKALQDQLAKFDLPLVASVVEAELGHDLTFAVLKGRSNYLCLQRVDELNDRSQQLDVDPSGTAAVRKLIEWSHETLTGDSGDIDWSLSDNAWRQVSVTSEECPGARKCPRGNDCFAERARALAQESDVIVVNTHLYALDIASDGSILPDHDVVVFDEAHQLEDVVSSSASVAIGPGRVASIASTIRSVIADDALYARFGRAGTSLTTALAARSGQRVALPLEQSIADALVELRLCTDDSLTAVQAISSENESVKQKALRAVTTATRLIEQIDSCLTASASFVAWVSGSADRPLLEI